jgi:hypothetical protein
MVALLIRKFQNGINFEVACYVDLFRVILKSFAIESCRGWGGLGAGETDKTAIRLY